MGHIAPLFVQLTTIKAMKTKNTPQETKGFFNPNMGNVAIGKSDPEPISDTDKGSVEEFLKQPNFNINEIDQKASTKTNFYILNNNWIAVVKYLKNLKAVVKWIYDNMQLDALIQQVLDKLETAKNEIPVTFDLPVSASYQVVSNKHTYKITRVDDYIITIECLTKKAWDVNNLMVTAKNNDNMIVYPAIQTKDSKIRVDFIDKIATNYRVIFI